MSTDETRTDETRWWWIRHAPVRDGGRIYGQRDLGCDCGDAPVFAALARTLPRQAVWLTSNLLRTHQTAAAIRAAMAADDAGAPPLAVAAFAEQHFGDWQGLDRREFHAGRGANRHHVWLAPADERAPGGESFADLVLRVGPAIERLSAELAGRDIVAVAHGGTIKAALAVALRLDPEAALSFAIDNCSLTRIDRLPHAGVARWRVSHVNRHPWTRPQVDGGPETRPAAEVIG
jgi:broad specificity phosphatase PhoE